MVECNASHFNRTNSTRKFYEEMKMSGQMFLCPPDLDSFSLSHRSGGLKASILGLLINICTDTLECETDPVKQKAFIEQIAVSSECVFNSIDFTMKQGLPLF